MIDIIALVLAVIAILMCLYIFYYLYNKIGEYDVLLRSMVMQMNNINKNEYDVITKNIKDIKDLESKVFKA